MTYPSPEPRTQYAPLRLSVAVAIASRLPCGALVGLGIVLAVHGALTQCLHPQPPARPELRQKVIALTQERKPRIIVAGDSRAAWQIRPAVLSAAWGRPKDDVINIAINNCGSRAVLAAYREFADRFAPNPLVILSLSLWSVNDRSPTYVDNDELLASIGWVDRLRLVDPRRALRAEFSVEAALWERLTCGEPLPKATIAEHGFEGATGRGEASFSPGAMDRQERLLLREWYPLSNLDGTRWRALESDLQTMTEWGATVVVVDPPFHAAWRARLSHTPFAELDRTFHEKLAGLTQRLGIRFLRCDGDWHQGRDEDTLFHDFVHLNREGAELFSHWIASKLSHMPEVNLLFEGESPAVGAAADRQ